MPFPCHGVRYFTHAMPRPCPALSVPCPFVKVRVDAGNIRTASPTVLTDRPFCSGFLTFFTVVGVDRCEEDWYASDNNLR